MMYYLATPIFRADVRHREDDNEKKGKKRNFGNLS